MDKSDTIKDIEKLEIKLLLFHQHLNEIKSKGSYKLTDTNISNLFGISQSTLMLFTFDDVVISLEKEIRELKQLIVYIQGKLLGML